MAKPVVNRKIEKTVRKVHISDKNNYDDEYWANESIENRLKELQRLRVLIGELNEEFKITTFKKVVAKKPIWEQDV
ncbi:MAG: hypothetical protein HYX40_01645 [Sphingobacteriales bacterium]|nr:hypothetical protein [Sphingobacteriales bacterium]